MSKHVFPIPGKVLHLSLLAALLIILFVHSTPSSGAQTITIGNVTRIPSLPSIEPTRVVAPNILFVVLDDWGVDGWEGGPGTDKPHTPTINALAQSGVVLPNTWVTTVCCSTRTEFMTGRFPFRTGMGKILDSANPSEFVPQSNEIFLPQMLKAGTNNNYQTVAVGKWHLSHDPNDPNTRGFDDYMGTLWNPGDIKPPFIPGAGAFYNYYWTVNGTTTPSTTYLTTKTADEAVNWFSTHTTNGRPFFMYLAFNAPHAPLHKPPANLHYQGNLTNASKRTLWKADIEAADTELGRILASLSPEVRANTWIFVTGDNGNADDVIVSPYTATRGKGSVYGEGINVPLIVSGPLVTSPNSTSKALVTGADFFATFAQIAGVSLTNTAVIPAGTVLDSINFLPNIRNPAAVSKRKFSMTQHFMPNGLTQGYALAAPPIPYTQQELMQFQGPGTPHLSVVGDYLDLGNKADIILTNALPNASVEIYISQEEDPQPLFGGMVDPLLPSDYELTGTTDASGNLTIPDGVYVDIEDFQQPRVWFYQAHITDGVSDELSNVVQVQYNTQPNLTAVRNEEVTGKCYKYIVSLNGNPQHEELYNLCTDPYEQNDLLANGPLTLGSEAELNYNSLKDRLDQWI